MQTKIAVAGDSGSVMIFKAVGFDVYETERGAYIGDLVAQLVKKQYGMIFVTEDIFAVNLDVAEKYKDDKLPAIIPVPGRNGSLGIGMKNIHKNVERAAGVDIFSV